MTGISLAEYDPSAPRQQLHALLKVEGPVFTELGERLQRDCPGVVISHDTEQGLMLVAFPEDGDRAGFLLHLVNALDVYSTVPTGAAPELLETRLVAVAEGNGHSRTFSRHFKLLNDPAEVIPGRPCLLVEHGTSFGSGRHPSTRLAMAALDRLAGRVAAFPARVLDVGCGSGILALACGLLGAQEVLGVDIDAGALAVAANNAEVNQLAARVRFSGRPLAEVDGPYDLLVANVTGAVMAGMVDDFARLVEVGGWLVISGPQGRQLGDVVAVFRERGFTEVDRFAEESWGGGLLQRDGSGSL